MAIISIIVFHDMMIWQLFQMTIMDRAFLTRKSDRLPPHIHCRSHASPLDAGKLGTYDILSVLPDKFARFLFEFHAHRFESLDLPHLPADRSDFDVHGALLDDKVQTYDTCTLISVEIYLNWIYIHQLEIIHIILIITIMHIIIEIRKR